MLRSQFAPKLETTIGYLVIRGVTNGCAIHFKVYG